MTLFGSGDAGWRYLDMAREPKPSRARLGQKRQHGSSLYHNCDLDYDLCRDDFPYRVYEYQKIPPLINCIPVKTRRTHMGTGGKSSPSPQRKARSSTSSMVERTKLQAEELHSIKGELCQIKAQVDSLLESLDHMDQRREWLAGSKESERKRLETGPESPSPVEEWSQGQEGRGADGHSDLRNIDSTEESTDTEEMGAEICRESTPGVPTPMAQVTSSLPTKASPPCRSTPGKGSAGTGTAQEGATASHCGMEEEGTTRRPLKGLLWNFRLVLSPTPTPAAGQRKPNCSLLPLLSHGSCPLVTSVVSSSRSARAPCLHPSHSPPLPHTPHLSLVSPVPRSPFSHW
ncbi:uncharacterized protein LOC133265097 isoform X2 [Pezoporus flaviventris]|uniref:uncharacterized protein LOC133265097 isoform X2 n=1 Tax=Pezoporus flaviventris TaxID=889875 RepID=UPI002AB0F4FC|nr:uncharacterized protein LOC133265097 isoform X2 [Pezoporus flaviventris]